MRLSPVRRRHILTSYCLALCSCLIAYTVPGQYDAALAVAVWNSSLGLAFETVWDRRA